MEDDFPRLELVQLQVVLGRPRCNVVEFCGARVGALSRDDEISVVCELDEAVVGVERFKVGGCDGVRRWSETVTLNNAG